MESLRESTSARDWYRRHSSLGLRSFGWYGNASRYTAATRPRPTRDEVKPVSVTRPLYPFTTG